MAVYKFVKAIGLYMIYFLSFLFPRNKKLWLYGSFANSFVDNSKHLFLFNSKNHPDVTHIWLTGSNDVIKLLRANNLKCYNRYSLYAIYLSLRAKVYIYSAYPGDITNMSLAGGAFKFNLWHGLPLKKIEYDIKVGPLQKIFNPKNINERFFSFISGPQRLKRASAVLITSNFFKEVFSSAFRVKEDKVVVGQYPRVMPFFWSEAELLEHVKKFEQSEISDYLNRVKQFSKVWIYMPTWRDANPNFMTEAIEDIDKLNYVCKQQNVLFVIKLHVNTVFPIEREFSNILVINNKMDIYPFLPFTTTLLTDYSSIFFDYALLNKKIVFYPFDINEYLSGSREFYFNYSTFSSQGIVVNNFAQLLEEVANETVKDNGQESQFKEFINASMNCNDINSFLKNHINL